MVYVSRETAIYRKVTFMERKTTMFHVKHRSNSIKSKTDKRNACLFRCDEKRRIY